MMREGLLLTALGVLPGVGIALLDGVALGRMLIGLGPADPVSLGGVAVVPLLVGAAASHVPARHGLTVDPSTALRSE